MSNTDQWIETTELNGSQRREVLREVLDSARELAQRPGTLHSALTEITRELEVALAKEEDLEHLEAEHARLSTEQAGAALQAADRAFALAIQTFASLTRTMREGAASDVERHAATALLRDAFPAGIPSLRRRVLPVQQAVVAGLVERLAPGGALASPVETLGLRRYVEQLEQRLAGLRTALDEVDPQTLTWDQVRAAREDAHERLCDLVVSVLYLLRGQDPEVAAARTRLLAPIERANSEPTPGRRAAQAQVEPETNGEAASTQAPEGTIPVPEPHASDDTSDDASSTADQPTIAD